MMQLAWPSVYRINLDFKATKEWEQWILLSADRHWDNPHSNHELQIKHLKQARERNARVFDFGDLFCAMQGRFDKRSSKSDLRPEHKVSNYLDSLVSTASDFFEPYADLIDIISEGNHETSIKKNHETDLTQRLVATLNDRKKTSVQAGKYAGWIVICLTRGSQKTSIKIKYNHGGGGGGEVTKGVIKTNRRAVYTPDADIVLSGHIHEAWVVEIPRERLNPSTYERKLDTQYHVQIPTYKEEFMQSSGWHIEREAPPKPLGAWWMRLYYEDTTVKFEFIRAN